MGLIDAGGQGVDGQALVVVTPDFGDAQAGVDGQFVKRGAGDVKVDDQVGRRVVSRVKAGFEARGGGIFEVKGGEIKF